MNEPLRCPKNSLSHISIGMAAQFTRTYGPAVLRLSRWMSRATSSLPVPDSPSRSTVASLAATARAVSNTWLHARDLPTGGSSPGRSERRR